MELGLFRWLSNISRDKLLDVAFLTGLSIIVSLVFYSTISANGLILGNDGSVHLARAQEFLNVGYISLDNLGWTPPLYQILLTFLISFTGITSADQLILLVKASVLVVNWLFVFSVYLFGARFFNRKTGLVASVLLFFCFPMFEINMWAGYTSVLGIAFMLLLFLYLPLSVERKSYMVIAGVSAFGLVLTHQLTMFVAALILVPVMLFLLIKTRGKGVLALVFIVIGGGVAFFLYYIRAMLPYLGGLIEHVFFAQKAMVYQISATSLSAFWSNFGFVLILGVAGLFVAAYKLWLEKKHVRNITLVFGFIVPLILAESFVFGLYLPFHWFVYYVMPFMTILAAVLLFFIVETFSCYFRVHKANLKRGYVRAVFVFLIVLSCFALVMRGSVLGTSISEAVPFYSYSDPMALQAGQWLKTNYPEPATVVVTSAPGFWFSAFCEKTVIAATAPTVERNVISESILDLSYEIETPLTLLRGYEAKGDISSETYVSLNGVWYLNAFSSITGDFISYDIDGVHKELSLSQMSRFYNLTITDDGVHVLTIVYANDDVLLTQIQSIHETSYPTQVSWSITPVDRQVRNVSLQLTMFLSLYFNFEKVYLPGILDWENPWDNPTNVSDTHWAVTNFYKDTLIDNYIATYDEQNQVHYALQFNDLPTWGNIGALGNLQVDAFRFSYEFDNINSGKNVSFSYQTLTFSEDSYYQSVPLTQVREMFTAQPVWYYTVNSRDYIDFINENNVGFLVYDKFQLDTKLIKSPILNLIYSNDRYAIFKVEQFFDCVS
ncbi:MAG: hypothetical protein LBE76_03450 [Nitrososphaerota archaeon]|jgi:hypothetical protein|nr:hypothetical protein [Nitrososphaerota archaeon]